MSKINAAIEAGGTKWRCAIGKPDGTIIDERTIKTGEPSDTLAAVIEGLAAMGANKETLTGLGIGSFGPLRVNPAAKDYGTFLNTPKPGWSGYNLMEPLRQSFGAKLPIYLDTDVNTAVYAESIMGLGKGLQNIVYVTVGTGIGAGVMVDGNILKGRMHPEVGHVPVQSSALEPSPNFSSCPFHDTCIEGKASGTAMAKRWGQDRDNFPDAAWELEADYLAQLSVGLTASYSPDLIIFGGGVSKHKLLTEMTQKAFTAKAGGYWNTPDVRDYIQVTSLDDRAGLIGAMILGALTEA